MRSFLQRIAADNKGATAIEYGLIVALIVIAIIGSLNIFATETISMWTNVDQKMQTATNSVP